MFDRTGAKREDAQLHLTAGNAKVAAVSGMRVKGVKTGKTKVAVLTENGVTREIDVEVVAAPTAVKLNKGSAKLSVGETLPPRNLNHGARYVFDNGQGGSGQRFDWSLLQGQDLRNVMLAGGLSADNCVEAAKSGCAGLDFNSGVESQPGIKEASLVAAVFQTLRAY